MSQQEQDEQQQEHPLKEAQACIRDLLVQYKRYARLDEDQSALLRLCISRVCSAVVSPEGSVSTKHDAIETLHECVRTFNYYTFVADVVPEPHTGIITSMVQLWNHVPLSLVLPAIKLREALSYMFDLSSYGGSRDDLKNIAEQATTLLTFCNAITSAPPRRFLTPDCYKNRIFP